MLSIAKNTVGPSPLPPVLPAPIKKTSMTDNIYKLITQTSVTFNFCSRIGCGCVLSSVLFYFPQYKRENWKLNKIHRQPAAGGNFLGFLSSFHVRKWIFLKDFEHSRVQNPQIFPPAAGCLRESLFNWLNLQNNPKSPYVDAKQPKIPLCWLIWPGHPSPIGGCISYIRK